MKQIKELSVREFYNFLTCQIEMAQSARSRLNVPLASDPAECLRNDISIADYLRYYGDDSAVHLSVEK